MSDESFGILDMEGTKGEFFNIAMIVGFISLVSKMTSTGLILVIKVQYFVNIESSVKAPTKRCSVVTSKYVIPKPP